MQEQSTRVCRKCGETRPLDFFRLRTTGTREHVCRPCVTTQTRDRRRANPARHAENVRRWSAANPEKVRATAQRWSAANPERRRAMTRRWREANLERCKISERAAADVKYAIKTGSLVRASACEECGTTGKRIEAAHYDYTRPLDVRWLCKSCHAIWDRAQPKTLIAPPPLKTIRLTVAMVIEMRKRAAAGEQQKTIADSMGLRVGAVNHAITGRSWGHIVDPPAIPAR